MPYTSKQISEELAMSHLGLKNLEDAFWNMPTPRLYEHALRNHEAQLADGGALVVRNGHASGQTVKDKYIVSDADAYHGDFEHSMSAQQFEALFDRVRDYLEGRQLYVEDALVAAESPYHKAVRIISQDAWHCLFAKSMFVRPADVEASAAFKEPDFTIIHTPHFHAVPSRDGTHAESFVILNFDQHIALIGGTAYAGEIKATVFAMMNQALADSDVLPLPGAVNVGEDGDSLLLLGPDGSGKSTLASDPSRPLRVDDVLGWNDKELFNFEAGCYVQVGHLDAEKEPVIHATSQCFGSILENVSMDSQQRRVDFHHLLLTENIRAAYPMSSIAQGACPGLIQQPKHLVLLASDAFGVLPAISRLSAEQVMYYFLLGYASQPCQEDAPRVSFSPCCGMPLMPHHPSVYAKILGAKVRRNNIQCWLLNTGFSGGPAGIGERMDIELTRTLLSAALQGSLDELSYQAHPVLGMEMPDQLDPVHTWHDQEDPDSYLAASRQLAETLKTAFAPFNDYMPKDVLAAGPR